MRSDPREFAKHARFYGRSREMRRPFSFATGFLALLLLSAFGTSISRSLMASPAEHDPPVGGADAKLFTGFEANAVGNCEQFTDDLGVWTLTTGTMSINSQLAKSGKHCLHLAGPKSIVELEVAGGVSPGDDLAFIAERWTAQSPFSFRIEKRTGEKWTEVFNGVNQIRVGRPFLSHVKIPLGNASASHLRFTVISPKNTGILIDDLSIAQAKPQAIVGVEVMPSTFPVLVGNKLCPLVKLRIETHGRLQPIQIKAMDVSLKGTSEMLDVDSVQVVSTGASESFNDRSVLSASPPMKASLDPLSFSLDPESFVLTEGTNFVWVACSTKSSADIDHRIGGQCKTITFSNGQIVRFDVEPTIQRMGIALRNGGDDGVNTYRIPGLATTNRGSLIAVYDVRYRNGGDLPGDIDVGMSRSVDGGRTWAPMQIVMDMGRDPKHRYDGVGDPAILVDRVNGTIWVAGLWSHGNRGWNGSGPGLTPEETGQLLLVRSDDDGVSWSKPINITAQVKQPSWCLLLQGPGKGITMQDGTLVFAAQHQDASDKKRLPYSTVIFSTDRGKTWQVGSGAFGDTTEAQVVETEPGILMLNCRYNRAASRVVMTSNDLGKTWQKHSTSENALIEPRACMASLIDFGRETNSESRWLLFSNPNSTTERHRITIKGSPDRGLSWPSHHSLLLDEGNGAGYSCMTMIDDKTVGIVYEGSQSHLTFQRIALEEIINTRTPPANSK